MRRHLLTTVTLTLLLAAVPASAALAGEQAGDAMEEPDDSSGDDGYEADDEPPAGQEVPAVPRSCARPFPALEYDTDSLTYGFEVDFSGCDWWAGGPIELTASIERFSGADDEGVSVMTLCGMDHALPEGDEETDAGFEAASPTCDVMAALDHPSTEVARYRGEATYPWEGGIETDTFEIFCVSTPLQVWCEDSDPTFDTWCITTELVGHCQDMPATPGL